MKKHIRVCLITDGLPPHCGGLPLIVYRRARGLHSIPGVSVMLAAWDRRYRQNSQEAYPDYVHPFRLRWPASHGIHPSLEFVGRTMRLGWLGTRLGTFLVRQRHEFDLLHAIGAASWSSLLAIPVAKALHKPVVLEMAEPGVDDPLSLNQRSKNAGQQLFPHRPLRYSLFLKADAYVSISHGLSEACRQAGLPESRLFQIPYGVDTDHFKPPTDKEKCELRAKLALDQESKIILFVGRITKRKGIRQLVAAVGLAAASSPKTNLLIVGPNMPPDPKFMWSVRNDINELGLSEQVNLIGVDKMVDNIADFMRASDIFCLPSEREGLGLVNIEAMATGLPIVVSRLEGVTTEFIQSGREGLLVPVGNVARLADALRRLLEDGPLRKRMGEAAQRRVLKDFSLDTYYRRHLDLYRQLLAGRSGCN